MTAVGALLDDATGFNCLGAQSANARILLPSQSIGQRKGNGNGADGMGEGRNEFSLCPSRPFRACIVTGGTHEIVSPFPIPPVGGMVPFSDVLTDFAHALHRSTRQ
jgi:hypothetical protein